MRFSVERSIRICVYTTKWYDMRMMIIMHSCLIHSFWSVYTLYHIAYRYIFTAKPIILPSRSQTKYQIINQRQAIRVVGEMYSIFKTKPFPIPTSAWACNLCINNVIYHHLGIITWLIIFSAQSERQFNIMTLLIAD